MYGMLGSLVYPGIRWLGISDADADGGCYNRCFSGPNGEDMEDWPSVLVPPGLTLKMLSTVPVAFGSTGPSTIQQSLDAFGLQFN